MKLSLTGPSGAGKSSIARAVADAIKHEYVDLGLFFRFATYLLEEKLCTNFDAIERIINSDSFSYLWNRKSVHMTLGGEDITYRLHSLPISQKTAELSVNPEALKQLIKLSNRYIAGKKNIVCDGRSAGTTILPDADYKFYITASPEIRAKRRLKELHEKDTSIVLEDVMKNIMIRDTLDSERKYNPLVIPSGAYSIDTGILEFEGSVNKIIEIIS
jgi:cytidylate kinase